MTFSGWSLGFYSSDLRLKASFCSPEIFWSRCKGFGCSLSTLSTETVVFFVAIIYLYAGFLRGLNLTHLKNNQQSLNNIGSATIRNLCGIRTDQVSLFIGTIQHLIELTVVSTDSEFS